MNRARLLTYVSLRTYARGRFVRHREPSLRLLESKVRESNAVDPSEFAFDDDIDEFESDFWNVGESYTEYEREERRAKDLLKNRIVASKCFKRPRDPVFLTFAERREMKRLHELDPDLWTAERLSESFPALPETVRKILKADWLPKSVDRVLAYDEVVIANWRKFRSGSLAIDPALERHLRRFGDRNIPRTDRDLLARQFVPPPPVFPVPRSSIFTNVIRGYANGSNKHSGEPKSLAGESEADEEVRAIEARAAARRKKKANVVSYNEFVKEKLLKLYEGSPEKAVTLIHEYQQYIREVEAREALKESTESVESLEEAERAEETIGDRGESDNSKGSSEVETRSSATLGNEEDAFEDLDTAVEAKSVEKIVVLQGKPENLSEEPEALVDTSIGLDNDQESLLPENFESPAKVEETQSFVLHDDTRYNLWESSESEARSEQLESFTGDSSEGSQQLRSVEEQASSQGSLEAPSQEVEVHETPMHSVDCSKDLAENPDAVSESKIETLGSSVSSEASNILLDDSSQRASPSDPGCDSPKDSTEDPDTVSRSKLETLESSVSSEASNILPDSSERAGRSAPGCDFEKAASRGVETRLKSSESSCAADVAITSATGVVPGSRVVEESRLDTYVERWEKHLDDGENFAPRIRIPENARKPGKLYRINDCYYDDDGEFLYRVPGLKN